MWRSRRRAPDQVLVEVAATSVNLSDWECLVGSPLYARMGGLRTPARRTLGSDVAGRVEAVGDAVTRFQFGDEVYGDNLGLKGGFAQYAVAPQSVLGLKPAELSFVEASAIPQAGPIALQGTAGAGSGDRVLVNGAGGGSGSFAIRRILAPGGRYRCVGGSVSTMLRVAKVGAVVGRLTGRLGVLAVRAGPEHFNPLADRCVAGEIDIYIDRTFGLDDVPEALAYVGEGHALGKVVIEI